MLTAGGNNQVKHYMESLFWLQGNLGWRNTLFKSPFIVRQSEARTACLWSTYIVVSNRCHHWRTFQRMYCILTHRNIMLIIMKPFLFIRKCPQSRHCLAPPEGPGTRGTPGVNLGGRLWGSGVISAKKKCGEQTNGKQTVNEWQTNGERTTVQGQTDMIVK